MTCIFKAARAVVNIVSRGARASAGSSSVNSGAPNAQITVHKSSERGTVARCYARLRSIGATVIEENVLSTWMVKQELCHIVHATIDGNPRRGLRCVERELRGADGVGHVQDARASI